jgi:hypothetical protein
MLGTSRDGPVDDDCMRRLADGRDDGHEEGGDDTP